jgi:hypothetical protein
VSPDPTPEKLVVRRRLGDHIQYAVARLCVLIIVFLLGVTVSNVRNQERSMRWAELAGRSSALADGWKLIAERCYPQPPGRR